MMKAFNSGPQTTIEEDMEYFKNHPLNAKEITPEMLELPEFKALQELKYSGTPEEQCKNFKSYAMESLNKVLLK